MVLEFSIGLGVVAASFLMFGLAKLSLECATKMARSKGLLRLAKHQKDIADNPLEAHTYLQ